jgi:putative FmdB family regulatory protein
MLYDYRCTKCNKDFDVNFKIGTATEFVSCSSCGSESKRIFKSMNFVLKGGGWPSKKLSFNQEMTNRNKAAGERMYKEHTPPARIEAYDYGNGDIRETK